VLAQESLKRAAAHSKVRSHLFQGIEAGQHGPPTAWNYKRRRRVLRAMMLHMLSLRTLLLRAMTFHPSVMERAEPTEPSLIVGSIFGQDLRPA
jgi:hypothetical protein